MTPEDKTLLEKEIEKSVKVRTAISGILTKNFPIEKDFADLIALDTIEQAIGKDRIEEYKNKQNYEKRVAKLKDTLRKLGVVGATGGGVLTALGLVIVIGYYAVGGIYSCATASPYPRTYGAIPEHARFMDKEGSAWKNTSIVGLSDENQLCVRYYTVDSRTCIHPNKANSLNAALEKAVNEDYNGILWNEPNGRGEIWVVERNNYRFIITAYEDENFK